ncbi:MAG: glutathione peroxidase [Phycisphaeraceae bacterium]
MSKSALSALTAALLLAVASLSLAAKKESPSVLNHDMKTIEGKDVNVAKEYGDKIVLVVNVASKCGYTKQYTGLQALYEKYKDKNFVILGVPANNFGGQEPGSDDQIAQFCSSKYKVTFPLLSKVSVKGDDMCELYKTLTSKDTNPKFAGDVKWNFEKFLVINGKVVARYPSKVTPEEIDADVAKSAK